MLASGCSRGLKGVQGRAVVCALAGTAAGQWKGWTSALHEGNRSLPCWSALSWRWGQKAPTVEFQEKLIGVSPPCFVPWGCH